MSTNYLQENQDWELKGKFLNQYVYIHRFNYYEDTKLPIAMFSYGVQNLFDQSTGPKLFKLQKLRQKIDVLDVVQLNKLEHDNDYNVWYEQDQTNKKLVNHELFWFGSVHYDEWKSSPICIDLMDKISDQYKLKSFLKARNILWILSAISSLIIGIIFPIVSIYVEIFANIETKKVKQIQKYNLWVTTLFGAVLVPLAATSAFNAFMKKDYFQELASLQCSTVLNNQAFANVARIIAKSFKDNIISIVFILIGQLINIYLFKKRKQQLKKMLNMSMQKLIAQSLQKQGQTSEEKKEDKKLGFIANLIENEEEKLLNKNQ